jgi:hypothetical protein
MNLKAGIISILFSIFFAHNHIFFSLFTYQYFLFEDVFYPEGSRRTRSCASWTPADSNKEGPMRWWCFSPVIEGLRPNPPTNSTLVPRGPILALRLLGLQWASGSNSRDKDAAQTKHLSHFTKWQTALFRGSKIIRQVCFWTLSFPLTFLICARKYYDEMKPG